jgi:hypothetical protein
MAVARLGDKTEQYRDERFDLAVYQQFPEPDRCMGEIGKVEPFKSD